MPAEVCTAGVMPIVMPAVAQTSLALEDMRPPSILRPFQAFGIRPQLD